MTSKVWIDGAPCDPEHARISVFDRGFLYGDSVFEVLRTYGGVPFALQEHLDRLARSAEQIWIPLPMSLDMISREVHRTLEAAGHKNSSIRVVVTRGSGPMSLDLSTARDPQLVIFVAEVVTPAAQIYRKGVSVLTGRASRPTDDALAAGVKASNYLSSLLAVHAAKRQGAYEVVLLGRSGEVLEGATSNIFAFAEGSLHTPRVEAGILAGITRAWILRLAEAMGIRVVQSPLFPRDLYAADEVFLTSSIREVVPVVEVDGVRIASGAPGPMTQRLHRAYRDEISRHCES